MLVLTRRLNQSVMVGDTRVKVIRVGRTIKLGFEGPGNIARGEIAEGSNLPAGSPAITPRAGKTPLGHLMKR